MGRRPSPGAIGVGELPIFCEVDRDVDNLGSFGTLVRAEGENERNPDGQRNKEDPPGGMTPGEHPPSMFLTRSLGHDSTRPFELFDALLYTLSCQRLQRNGPPTGRDQYHAR